MLVVVYEKKAPGRDTGGGGVQELGKHNREVFLRGFRLTRCFVITFRAPGAGISHRQGFSWSLWGFSPRSYSVVPDRTSVVPDRTSACQQPCRGCPSTVFDITKSSEIHRKPQKSTEINRNTQKSLPAAGAIQSPTRLH